MTSRNPVVPITAVVLAAPDAPAEIRGCAADGAGQTAQACRGIALVTCQRVELYLPSDTSDEIAAGPAWRDARRLGGIAAARHAIGVAVGLESAVLGEDQVLHQLRTAVSTVRAGGGLSEPLEILFEFALRAGRTARSWRPTRARSLADVAIARLATDLGGNLAGRRVLILGAGEMGRLSALAASRSGAVVTVASPTFAHATTVAVAVGGRAVPFDPQPEELAVDGIVIALSGAWSPDASAASTMTRVTGVVDLSMLPALPAAVRDALGDRYVDLDGLTAGPEPGIVDGVAARYRARLEGLRMRTLEAYLERLASRTSADVAAALADRIEHERSAELAALWRRLPDLPPDDRVAIETMTRVLADRLFRTPLARLGADRDGRRRQVARELFEL